MAERRINGKWLSDPALLAVVSALAIDGDKVRIAGGAVRDALLDMPIGDIDLATTCTPSLVVERLEAAGLKALKTGFDHGTVTAVSDGATFEVTTLREDVATNGRRATVEYGRDWTRDAERRDLTMNALYLDLDGTLHDPLGGYDDVMARQIRFIGEASQRIEEDYLRILRFFRFFAHYGSGRPDADGLRACTRLKEGLDGLSAERIWMEMRKLFAAPDPSRALLWMRQTGVLTRILPESEKWGIDGIHRLMAHERAHGLDGDAVLRLMAIVPTRDGPLRDLSKRWKISNCVRDRMVAAISALPSIGEMGQAEKRDAFLYKYGAGTVCDALILASLSQEDASEIAEQHAYAKAWVKPEFPVSGDDLLTRGFTAGPDLGAELKRLEQLWIDSGFVLARDQLLSNLTQ